LLLVEVQDKMVEMNANQDELREGCDQWRIRERILMDQRWSRGGVSGLSCYLFRTRKPAPPAYSHGLS
jgi:hypothetical protein